jgi:UDP-glucose 4-epimerase
VRDAARSRSPIEFVPYSDAYPPGFDEIELRAPDLSALHALIPPQNSRSLDEIISDVILHAAGERSERASRDVPMRVTAEP